MVGGANAAVDQCSVKGGEYSVFNAAKGVFYTNSSDGCAFTAVKWGMATDKIVPADYDGDGSIDAAVWRPSNATWLIRRSSDAKAQIVKFGSAGDIPVAGDYNGDGKAEIAVWRPTTGEWLIGKQRSSCGVYGDVPVPADYDGDGKIDIAIFRPSENRWMILQSSDNKYRTEVFGDSKKDTLVPADYTGDGKADLAATKYSCGHIERLILQERGGHCQVGRA